MNAATRNRAARLEAIMARHIAYEQRTLSDLRRAGFHFTTIAAAVRRLKAIRTIERMTAEDRLELAITAIEERHR